MSTSWRHRDPASTEYPPLRGAATPRSRRRRDLPSRTTRLRGISTSRPRRSLPEPTLSAVPSSRPLVVPSAIHAAPAASPRSVPRNIHVVAAASPRSASTEYPRLLGPVPTRSSRRRARRVGTERTHRRPRRHRRVGGVDAFARIGSIRGRDDFRGAPPRARAKRRRGRRTRGRGASRALLLGRGRARGLKLFNGVLPQYATDQLANSILRLKHVIDRVYNRCAELES